VDLAGADLTGANLVNVKLQNANLQGAKLRLTNLNKLDFSGLDLAKVNLSGADLGETNLSKVCLGGANLERASLRWANLIGANLKGANLKRADLTGANIYRASFEEADLTAARMPDGEIYKSEAFVEEISTQGTSEKNSEIVIPATRKVIFTDQAPVPVGAYSQAIASSGQLIFVAGQIAIDLRLNGIVYTDDVAKQTKQVMTNIGAILAAAGATLQDVVKTTVFLADMNEFAAMNAVYANYFDEATAPARVCVQVSQLPKDVLVEIDCIAVIEPK
jgi:2-iminobutanoate/2-iminopropanoate deaminase